MASTILDGNAIQTEIRYANFGNRLGAAVIDILVLLPLLGASFYFTVFSPNLSAAIMVNVLSFLYKPAMEGLFGATVGKMALKLKVVGPNHERVEIGPAFIRALPWAISSALGIFFLYRMFQIPGLVEADGWMEYSMVIAEYQVENPTPLLNILQQLAPWLPLVSALFMLGNRKNQAAHDQLANTYVIHTGPVN